MKNEERVRDSNKRNAKLNLKGQTMNITKLVKN